MVFFHHARFWVFPSSMLISACQGLHPIGYLMMLLGVGWLLCCWSGLSVLMVVPSGLGPPVLPWSRSRLRRGSGIRWTGIVSPLPVRPCPAPACNTGIGHRRAPGSPDIRRHPAISAGRLHAGCRRYRVRRVHARRHRYQADAMHPISIAAPAATGDCRYRFPGPTDIVSSSPPPISMGTCGATDIGRMPPGH